MKKDTSMKPYSIFMQIENISVTMNNTETIENKSYEYIFAHKIFIPLSHDE